MKNQYFGDINDYLKYGLLRIIHGKGTGALRETVHAILGRTPGVASFGLAPANAGAWGVTVVALRETP